MVSAMRDAQTQPDAITYVNAHGSSTPLNDATETLSIKLALGDRAYAIPVSGTKAMHGHALGASAAIEAATIAGTIERGRIEVRIPPRLLKQWQEQARHERPPARCFSHLP